MNFKLLYILFFLFSSNFQEENKASIVSEILKNKPDNYDILRKKLKTISIKEVMDFYRQSKKENYKLGEVCSLNTLGTYYRKKSNYDKALTYHNKALIISEENSFLNSKLTSLNSLGVVYRRTDDIRSAIDYHQSVISLVKKIKSPSINTNRNLCVAINSLGNIYASLDQNELAIQQFQKAISLQTGNDLTGLAINYQNIGVSYENLNSLDIALNNYETSLEYNNQINSTLGKVICNNSISSIFIKKGNYNGALKKLDSIYPLVKSLGNQYYLSETLSNLGWAQLKIKDYKNSLKNLNSALEITEKLQIKKTLQIDILLHLSELFEEKNDLKKSLSYYKEAVDREKNTIGQRNNIHVNNLIVKQDIQSQKNAFNELQNETEIKSLQLARNRNILIITLVTLALLSVVLYSVYRQHLLKNDQKILLLEQQALQTQMNPHFVFNALNSIKHYIISNEQKNAVFYLNKFSKLIRNILEVSKVKEVSLKEELATMSLYMSIENIRFDNSIIYTEKIPTDLNIDTIKLPPLVLQPFIENSIWHGLSSKEGKREIIVSVEKTSPNIIQIDIMDNGIGREAAIKIKNNKSLKRKSFGINLTKARLTTFCNEYSEVFSLKYHDLKDEKGTISGTKASLEIPLY